VFVLAVGTYTALPQLAPAVAPANAADPVRENQIESTDPYMPVLLLASFFGLVLTVVVRTGSGAGARRALPERGLASSVH